MKIFWAWNITYVNAPCGLVQQINVHLPDNWIIRTRLLDTQGYVVPTAYDSRKSENRINFGGYRFMKERIEMISPYSTFSYFEFNICLIHLIR